MVDEALVARLTDMLQESFPKAKHLEEKLRHLFSYNQEPHKFTEEETRTLIAAIDSLKILDPACGSGAFPMGVIHKLVFILSKLDPENKHWLQRQIERVNDLPDPTIRDVLIKDIERAFRKNALDYGRKLFLIENCVFGVDIQPVAVQIAKLRFLISLIVEQQVHVDSPNRGIRPLPNLETKIVSADTLIPIPRPEQLEMRSPAIRQREAALKKVRNNQFNARTPSAKATCRHQDEQLRQEIAQLLISEGWHDAIARKLSAWNPYSPNTPAGFFDPEWMFQVAEGFDVVIGNPPYIQIQRFSGKQEQIDWQRHYVTFDRKGDVYCLFYERGINLLKKKGVLAYISSNKWMRANYGNKTRKFFAENTDPFLLVDFDACKVFEGVTVNTCVLGVKKGAKHSTFPACTLGTAFSIKTDIDRFVRDHAVPMDNVSEANWLIASKQGQDLKTKIESLGIPLSEWDISMNYGVKTGYNKAFILPAEQKDALIAADPRNAEIIHPVVRGKDIKRWRTDFADLWLINTHNGYGRIPPINVVKDYPTIKIYLDAYWNHLEQRQDQGVTPYNLRNCAYVEEFKKQKIAWGNLTLNAQFGFVPEGFCVNAPSPIITPASKYLLAVLNSKVADYYIRQLGVTRNGGYFEYKPMFVEQLPVPQVSPESQEPFEDLVDQILILSQSEDYRHNTGKHAKVKEYEQEIDRLVYDLYQLTEDEIKIVEAN